jgi:long-chain acyl-CoA synthetase
VIPRPWLAGYCGLPHTIATEHPTGLDMFRAAVARTGERPLMHFLDTPISGADADAISDALAAAFAARGVGRGDRIALILQNVPQFVLVVAAAWKLGAIVVPFNPMLKHGELSTLFADAAPAALIADPTVLRTQAGPAARAAGIRLLVTTGPFDWLAGAPPTSVWPPEPTAEPDADVLDLRAMIEQHLGQRVPDPNLTGDDVAFLVYTSGTTGPAKGAMNLHRNVVFTSTVFTRWLNLTPSDTILAFAPLFHITGLIAHIGAALASGAGLVLTYRFDAGLVLELIERHRVTFTIGAITGYIAMLNDPTLTTRDLSSWTKVYSGGAPVPEGVIKGWQRAVGTYIHNGYGLTETTTATHLVPYGVVAPVDPGSGAVAVGLPVFDTTSVVVDERGAELPPGEAGEIVTSGPGVVPGYWRRPEETAATMPEGRFHTGDVGFMDEQGWFYLIDRRKDMIVVSGYKVWPREVEDLLYRHPAIREAGVVGVPDEYRGESVKAYVCLKDGASATAEELITFCREHAAAYKCPRTVEFVDELPKTATGKVLRRELRSRSGPRRRPH